jgi:chemotaxis methyl-accepting protein methylase
LIVGPGLDFAPRTDFIDMFGPQSYQPFAVADALLSLKLCDAARLQIDCVDINERVVAHLQSLRRRGEVTLSILSGVSDGAGRALSENYKDYFRNLGSSVGRESAINVPPDMASHLKKSLRIGPEVTGKINGDRLNIITERFERSDGSTPNYDLVVVTNVFPYFKPTELLFALTNISEMLAEGGYLIHNELQTIPSFFITPLGLPLRQARTVLIASSESAPLFDGVAIHEKAKK